MNDRDASSGAGDEAGAASLGEADAWFRAVFVRSLDGVLLTRPDGSVFAANPAACRILGRSEADLLRCGRADVVDPSDPRLARALDERAAAVHFAGELRFVRGDGTPFPVELSSSVRAQGGGAAPGHVIIFGDIAARVEAEAARCSAEARFESAFRNSPDGVTITRVRDGRYVEVNDGVVELLGYPADEFVGHTVAELGIRAEPEGAAEAPSRRGAELSPLRGTETLLVVEDEPALLAMTTSLLEGLGDTVLPASSPDAAVRIAEARGGEVDLLVTDVVMPGMNGRELAAALVARHPRRRHLYMSGYTADVIARQGVLEEGVTFLEKRFTRAALATQVRAALARR